LLAHWPSAFIKSRYRFAAKGGECSQLIQTAFNTRIGGKAVLHGWGSGILKQPKQAGRQKHHGHASSTRGRLQSALLTVNVLSLKISKITVLGAPHAK
jgi:hypothetical protein